MMTKKALIISYFKSSNFGDCILSNQMFEFFNGFLTCKKINYSLSPFEYSNLNKIQEIENNSNAKLKTRILKFLSMLCLNKVIYFFYKHKQYLSKKDKQKVNALIRDVDIVIIGGGNMLFDLENNSLSAGRLNYFINMIRKQKKLIVICSIGFGPFQNISQLKTASKALYKADIVSFRDKNSRQLYIHTLGSNRKIDNSFLSSDPAFLLPNKFAVDVEKKYIGINLIDPMLFTHQTDIICHIKKLYYDIIMKTLNYGYYVIVFSTELRDCKFMEEVCSDFQSDMLNLCCPSSLKELLEIYKKTKIVIGTRMHSMILALTQYVPIIGLSWQKKVDSLFQMIGMEDYVYDIKDVDSDTIIETFELLLKLDDSNVKILISKILTEQKLLYYKNQEAILKLLN